MIANGVVSIVGGFVTAWSLGWVLTTPGVVSYVGWNILGLEHPGAGALDLCDAVAAPTAGSQSLSQRLYQ